MKSVTVFTAIILSSVLISCQSNKKAEEKAGADVKTEQVAEAEVTSIEFNEKTYDFGQIKEGEKVAHTFVFTNTGDKNLLVKSVKASCGCTASNFTREAVAPGETGKIEVVFNSDGRPGPNHKSLTVVANTDPKTTVLTFNVDVVKK